jgi:hypothetical protein
MSYTDMLSSIKTGLQRSNRWEVEFLIPGASNSKSSNEIKYLAKSASIPDSTIGEIEIINKGKSFFIPGDREVQEFSLTFICTQDLQLHDDLWIWSNNLMDVAESTQNYDGDMSKMQTDITLWLLNVANKRIKKFVLTKAWIKTVAQLDLTQDKNTVVEFACTFRYLHVKVDK